MIKVLIVSATKSEIDPLLSSLNLSFNKKETIYQGTLAGAEISVIVTGVGMVSTTYALTKHLCNNTYNCVINIGIAGAFDRKIEIGDVVEIISEQFSEIGAEDGKDFLSVFDLNLVDKNLFPYRGGKLVQIHKSNSELREVRAITVNTCHGDEEHIEKVLTRLTQSSKPHVESMEGGAFFHVCLMQGTIFYQFRAISNYVERRNKENWNITLAIENSNRFCVNFLPNWLNNYRKLTGIQ